MLSGLLQAGKNLESAQIFFDKGEEGSYYILQ